MLAFWWPRLWRRQHYRVLVRPTLQGEFLVFPHGWRRHGKGYLLSRTLKNRLEAPDWRWYDALILAACLGMLLLAFTLGWGTLAALAAMAAAWGWDMRRRYLKRVEEVTALGRFAGVVLSRARYELEYASQCKTGETAAALGFAMALGLAAGVGAGMTLKAGHAMGAALLAGVAAAACWGAARQRRLLKAGRQAYRFSVMAGDPVDMPLPEAPPDEPG